jgi:hypothetical protein
MYRMGPYRLTLFFVVMSGLIAVTGCGSHSEASTPDVGSRVVRTDSLLGFPPLTGLGAEVVTDPAAWVSGGPFPLYLDSQQAIADLGDDGFVAGILKVFKPTQGMGSAGNVVVQMRDAEGAANELERQTATAAALPCPENVQCTKAGERFDVPGIPDAAGVDVKQTFADPQTLEGTTFNTTHDLTIVFTKGPFVYQLFVGGPGMEKRRGDLIAAAHAQYERA